MKTTLSVRSVDASSGDTGTKAYGNITKNYARLAPYEGSTPLPYNVQNTSVRYANFAEWCDQVARGLNSLTTNTYAGFNVTAVFTDSDFES